ncbi:hypothetical protein BCR42DRAFT_156217 [Absidia repens]|uniref:Uncharacterized protein n=1 Tax=Absidia repens TaxID=90262 RepID=A0A1X2I0S8_9FUNG|nr:hypothetical protein BCR42DRAFT_156217 [Absidia repens]
MHFVFEALHKRPLESKSLAISRGLTAVFLSCCFLAYVGYLIYQVYNDRTLLLLSTYNIPDTGYVSPDVEMCVTGSTFRITACVFQDLNYEAHIKPGCEGFLNYGANNDPSEKCIAFQGNDSKVMFAPGTDTSKDANLVHRVDIFWAIDNLTAVSSQSLSRPNMAITTMSQEFSSWRITPDDMEQLLPEQAITWNSLQLQKYVSSSAVNQSTMIYFEPSRYRALKKNAQSVIGLNSTYYEMDIIETNQFEWDFNHLFPNYETYGDYQGQFGIALRTSNVQVQTEQRQHTVLAALALAGGCYGVLTALYILLFGTPRLTPFGVSHNLSMWFYRGRTKLAGSTKIKTTTMIIMRRTTIIDVVLPSSRHIAVRATSVTTITI